MMAKKRFYFFFALCGFPLVAASSETNGTRGEPLLWQCTLSEQFDPEKVGIYWQNQNNNEMLHYYRNGKEDLEHQSVSFKNRTKIFPDQLRSGNLSLIIDPLMPEDNLKSLKVVFNHAGDIKDKLCQTMVHVAANFKEPNIEINQKKMTATCTTQGGFPEPELAWISTDHEGHERALEPPDVLTLQIHKEEDGTYSIISTANFTGSKTVTCTVYNPTSNKTVGATADLPAGEGLPVAATAVIGVFIVLVVLVVLAAFGYKKYHQQRQQRSNGPEPSAAYLSNGALLAENGGADSRRESPREAQL
ncbi:ICOS ligand isoform X2 [Oreochromis niloticus]|uniref:ICOS ligand isoform X2 n=1 Tax=Oreochromis niloticus TaxID=8128 RepID=UPI0006747D8D|nr:ICOS ligand isoform X2 [Oreochromis niloticus]